MQWTGRGLLPIDVEVREHIEVPPRLYAIDRKRKLERKVLDPNPDLLQRFQLGTVKRVFGRLSTGESWSAFLYLPVRYAAGRRYPLVIQSQYHVPATDKFTLYGWSYDNGLGPVFPAPYAAQSLAGRGIAVLHLNVDDAHIGEPSEGDSYRQAFEETAAKFAAEGVVDASRVGLLGFSRNGYFVMYALSHSKFPFAAAIAADNLDPSYLQTTLLDAYDVAELAIGAKPFGLGLQTWLERAPGFNVDRIQTPLRLVGQSAGLREYILWQWETFSRLKRLDRPVEMYLMPDIDAHPAHSTQNPKQILAVQESTVDWFDFWLNGREDSSPAKSAQYIRWRRLNCIAGSATGLTRQ